MKRMFSILLAVLASHTAMAADELQPADEELPEPLPQYLADPPRQPGPFRKWCAPLCRLPLIDATLHAVVHRGDTTFIVFTHTHPAGHDNESTDITWMTLRAGIVLKFQSLKLRDDWRPIGGSIHGWQHGVLHWGADGMFARDGQLVDGWYSAIFDPQHPDQGLQMKETHQRPPQ